MAISSFRPTLAPRLGKILAVGIVTAVLIANRVGWQSPPAVLADAPLIDFSSARAMQHVRQIASSPHPTGSASHARVMGYLASTLENLGLDVAVRESAKGRVGPKSPVPTLLHNVVGRLRGTEGGPAVALVAHYDTVPQSPGAGDDSVGVATLLETARALIAGGVRRHDVLFIFTDAEELGLLGAAEFVENDPWRKDVGLVLNFDARGNRGPVAMYATSGGNAPLIPQLAASAPWPVANSALATLARLLPNDTDLSVFLKAGYAGYGFAFVDGLSHYHRPTDTPLTLDEGALQHDGSYALTLASAWSNGNLGSGVRGGDEVFFDVFGRRLVHYSVPVARWLALGTAILAILCLRALVGPGRRKALRLLKDFVTCFAAVLVGGLVVFGLGATAVGVAGIERVIAHDRLFAIPIFAVPATLFTALLARATRSGNTRPLVAASLGLLAGAGVLTAIAAPATSFVFVLPAAGGLLANRIEGWVPPSARPICSAIGAIPAVVVVGSLAHATFIMTGATMPALPALFGGILMLGLLPVLRLVVATPRSARRLATAVCLVAVVGFLGAAGYARLAAPRVASERSLSAPGLHGVTRKG